MVTNKKMPVMYTNNSNNNSHLNAVVGIVVDSVAGAVVVVEEEGRWLMGIKTVESENRARFSRKEGEYILIVPFLSGGKFLIEHLSLTGVDTEINATSATKLIEIPAFFIALSFLSPTHRAFLWCPALALCPLCIVNYTRHLHT